MAIITKIREKSGVAILVVAVAMIAFILGADFLSGNSQIIGSGETVGEINGTEIDRQAFLRGIDQARQEFQLKFRQAPQDAQMEGLRRQEWEKLVYEYAYKPQFEQLGIQVTPEEVEDMINGNNINSLVAQYFPGENGQPNLELINNVVRAAETNPEASAFMQILRRELVQARAMEKYQGLFDQTAYATTAEGKRKYEDENTKVDVKYLYIPYTTVADSMVTISDSDIKDYYNSHSEKYEREANRELKYITISRKATPEDEKVIEDKLKELIPEFEQAENDSAFADINSEGLNNFKEANPKSVPQGLDFSTIEVGKVYGPFKEGDAFKLYKVSEIKDDSLNWMKARHILIKPKIKGNDESEAEATKRANEILAKLRAGADFAETAKEFSEGPSKTRGGDLGWFKEGDMVTEFNEAVLNATRPGLINKLVKTNFGYHIITVEETKSSKDKLAVLTSVEFTISASQRTEDMAYRKVGSFLKYTNAADFEDAVNADSSMRLIQALNVRKNARNLNNLTGPRVRQIIQWAYNDDTEVGDVSSEFELEDEYVIAVLIGKSEKGVADFEQVKAEAKAEALKKVKGEYILNKLKTVSGGIDEMKTAYGNGATVNTNNDLSLDNFSLKGVGFAPKAIGTISSMEEGATSAPILDENGVVIIQLVKKTKPAETADYASYSNKLVQKRNRNAFKIKQAIEEYAEVKDELYKYY
ncbi:MAG: peptidylprolyl isomerase [Flammeovirgaceae bacterium]